MPIGVSANKSLRVAQRRASENKIIKSRVKNRLKSASVESLAQVFSILDKAAKKHVLHKNKAARLKSKLAQQFGPPMPRPKVAKAAKAKTRAKTKPQSARK